MEKVLLFIIFILTLILILLKSKKRNNITNNIAIQKPIEIKKISKEEKTKKEIKLDNLLKHKIDLPIKKNKPQEIGGSKYYRNIVLSDDNLTANEVNYKSYGSYRIKPTTLSRIKKTKRHIQINENSEPSHATISCSLAKSF